MLSVTGYLFRSMPGTEVHEVRVPRLAVQIFREVFAYG